MPTKRAESRSRTETVVNYHFEDRVYQIDAMQKKVYRRFVEIETSKAAEILSAWRAHTVSV